MNRQFKGVWFPKEIYLNKDLSWTEKILLIEIHSLQGDEGCYASNQHLADFVGVREEVVSNYISKLKQKGYIQIVQLRHPRRMVVSPEVFNETPPCVKMTSQKNEARSQKNDLTSQKNDLAIYRKSNTENNTAVVQKPTTALGVYRKYFPFVPLHVFNQELLDSLETDLDVFEQVMDIWVGRQYREQNIKGMMSLFDRLLADKNTKEQKLFCDKCEPNSGWLPVGEGWERCKH